MTNLNLEQTSLFFQSSKSSKETDFSKLLRLASSTSVQMGDAGERRQLFLTKLLELLGASGGFWGWGRGRPGITAVIPVASIPVGFSQEVWAKIVEFSLSNDGQRIAQEPIFKRLIHESHATVLRSDLIDDDAWHQSHAYTNSLESAGLDDFLTSVRYYAKDSWHCLTFFRQTGLDRFTHREASLVHMVLSSIDWLEPKSSETVPPDAFAIATPKQRVIMLYLLDGLPRKQIAAALGITLHTVNDHIKALYERFEVTSATELAAKFLKSI